MDQRLEGPKCGSLVSRRSCGPGAEGSFALCFGKQLVVFTLARWDAFVTLSLILTNTYFVGTPDHATVTIQDLDRSSVVPVGVAKVDDATTNWIGERGRPGCTGRRPRRPARFRVRGTS